MNHPHKHLPRTVWALGFVSLFMDISSEMVHSLLPVFLWSVLQVNTVAIGFIEGIAEAAAMITKAFSGVISDRLGKRKPLVFIGYSLGALTKPFFAMAGGAGMVLGARLTDRVGKGIRGAPRDALVADVTDGSNRGAAYGLRQSLDTVGALFGPLLAAGLMVVYSGDYRRVFWIAVIPGLLAAAIVWLAVKEPPRHPSTTASSAPANPATADTATVDSATAGSVTTRPKSLPWQDAGRLGRACWLVLAFGGLFSLARFSEAFLLLRGQDTGLTVAAIPLILVLMNLIYALTAYPVGYLSDRLGTKGLLAGGLVVLMAANAVLAQAHNGATVALGAALWGLHLGLTQGLLAAMVAAAAPVALRGTAFGMFGLISGMATLGASLVAGGLWAVWGPAATFFVGGGMAGLSLMALIFLDRLDR